MNDRSFRRGAVVWGLDPFKSAEDSEPERPFLVLSNETHPFADRQFAGVALSTTRRDEALALDPDDWAAGGLPRRSYAYPWLLVTRDHADIASVMDDCGQPSWTPYSSISSAISRHETAMSKSNRIGATVR
ncbi:hypothetical protein [Halococcus sp. AFM35]|uniref:hypothetical protein n=1 Tax=Halococcus sp. AFM35 TaxID=3421653 RepID=UPI003EB8E1F0